MSYTYVVNEDNVSLYNLSDGNKVTIYNDDSRYDKFKELILLGDYDTAEKLDVKVVVEKFSGAYRASQHFNINIVDGIGTVNIGANSYPLADAIVNRIIKMEQEGFTPTPLVNFLENLYMNPSKTAVDELYLFLERSDLPITTDGCFIAYKIVKEDFTDIYSGKFDNSVGKVVEMPRFAVDDKRSNTCSAGLHFCSKSYLSAYGSSKQETDKCVLVKINPQDVVSIPEDYNNAKGRACKYEVVGVMEDAEWRKILSERDYNTKSVVDEYGEDLDDEMTRTFGYYFYVDEYQNIRWKDSNRIATKDHVIMRISRDLRIDYSDAETYYDDVTQ